MEDLKRFTYTGPDIKPRAGGIAGTIHTGHVVRLTRDEAQSWARSRTGAELLYCRLTPDATYEVLLPARHLRPDHSEEV